MVYKAKYICYLALHRKSFFNYILLIMLLQLFHFFPFAPLQLAPPTVSGNPHAIVHVHGSCVQVLWLLHFLYCILHLHGYSVTTNLYFLIPSPLHPFPPAPSHLATMKHFPRIHDSVSVLVHLVCFLDSTVDRYIFIAILLFVVLIFFS